MNSDFLVGHWLVKPSLNCISCRDITVRLEPKVMDLLICLAQHVGETLPKEALLESVWSGTFVTDDVLTHSISELRRAFKDDAREPQIIQTIPKRGYRLLAPVNAACAVTTPRTTVIRDSIVVLPFISMSSEVEDEVFSDGMTEEIINALAQIEQLHVVARTTAFSFKGKYINVRAIGKRLNVRTVLLGSLRRAGNKVRITAQLINVEDGYHLWSDRYDREVKDIFEIQDEIARSIAERLKVTLKAGEQEFLVKSTTKSLEAYQLTSKVERSYTAAAWPFRALRNASRERLRSIPTTRWRGQDSPTLTPLSDTTVTLVPRQQCRRQWKPHRERLHSPPHSPNRAMLSPWRL